MRRSVSAGNRCWSGVRVALVGLAMTVPPSWAAEAPASPSAPKSLRAAIAAKAATLDTKPAASFNQQAGAGGSSDSGRSFFRTKKGVAALILMAGGVTWAVISRKNDAVHSPAR